MNWPFRILTALKLANDRPVIRAKTMSCYVQFFDFLPSLQLTPLNFQAVFALEVSE